MTAAGLWDGIQMMGQIPSTSAGWTTMLGDFNGDGRCGPGRRFLASPRARFITGASLDIGGTIRSLI